MLRSFVYKRTKDLLILRMFIIRCCCIIFPTTFFRVTLLYLILFHLQSNFFGRFFLVLFFIFFLFHFSYTIAQRVQEVTFYIKVLEV